MFKLSKLEWLVLAAGLLLCPGSPWSAEATESVDALFDRLDRNKDGYLSRDELAADAAKRGNWIAIDRDGDGRIGRREFGLITAEPRQAQPDAAAGATAAPKAKPKPE